MPSERPILFSGPMVKALLVGRKTQTRRVVKPLVGLDVESVGNVVLSRGGLRPLRCPYGAPGDRLWVRETWAGRLDQDNQKPDDFWGHGAGWFRADGDESQSGCAGGRGRWRPSIHMPRWASRMTLEVVSVRVERLQEITEEDAVAEGAPAEDEGPVGCCRCGFIKAWDSINGKRPGCRWDENPFVFVVAFRRLL